MSDIKPYQAPTFENRLDKPDIIGATIKYFWVKNAEEPGNLWRTGVVIKEKDNARGYYLVKFKTLVGFASQLLIPLGNPKYNILWYRFSDNKSLREPTINSSAKVRTWVLCARKKCKNWLQLPVGLHRVVKNFACSHASLWGNPAQPCSDP